MDWKLVSKKVLLKSVPFAVEVLDFVDKKTGKALSHPFHRLTSPDWVNILPVTADGHAVLVRQNRAGSLSKTLEVPGGMVDDGEDLAEAAKRELEEETGYSCGDLQLLGAINPNPAIMNNTVHMFLATNCELLAERSRFPDENEFIEIELVPVKHLVDMVQKRQIDSALAALTIMMARNRVE